MTRRADAIIIGAGVIGAATAFELCKRGYKTLNIDKLPASGYGPTSNSCAIVRAHYSSRDGVAMAYEGFFYWQDWERYLGAVDDHGHGALHAVRHGAAQERDRPPREGPRALPRPRRRVRGVGRRRRSSRRSPSTDTHAFWPPRRPDDPHFWDEPQAELDGAIFTPGSGYVNDPQLATHNLQRAAEAKGGEFLFRAEVAEIRRADGRVAGVTLTDGTEIDAPIVVNVAGPHSFVINRMAGVEDEMNVKTRALRHEVHHVPSPPDFDFEHDGYHTSDGDTGIYFRPESGNNILIGSEDPDCDPRVWVDEPDKFDRHVTEQQWEAQVFRLARRMPSLRIPNERKGIVDLYDVSDDWIPIYDRSVLDGFYMAIGTSGNQFKNAPVVGHLMAELIDRVEHGHDHDADPVQVRCAYNDEIVLDAGFYSRLREINPNSSFSVNG